MLKQVALKRFVDDIAVEVIEAKLISHLYDIFSPMTVISMSADLVTSIAGESEENRVDHADYREFKPGDLIVADEPLESDIAPDENGENHRYDRGYTHHKQGACPDRLAR